MCGLAIEWSRAQVSSVTSRLPIITAAAVFAPAPFLWFAAVPLWIGYLAIAALLACLALEAWKGTRHS
jgi:hypothetical protein